jgi:hypothetical protein
MQQRQGCFSLRVVGPFAPSRLKHGCIAHERLAHRGGNVARVSQASLKQLSSFGIVALMECH